MTDTIAEALADHFHRFPATPVEATRTAVRRLLLDYLGVGLGGSRTGSGRVARQFAAECGGVETATLVGDVRRVPPVHAAFANAICSHSVELDDIDVLALFHFSPPVYSAAIAVAESVGASGAELVRALAAGCEMMERLSRAANPSLRDRGFHTTPTCGAFGAAIASALLLKLDRDQIVHTLGMAGAQASGLMEMYGPSMQKRLNPGPAARNGVTAAMLAKLGFTGASTIFEGERGFLAAFSDRSDPGQLTAELDRPFRLDVEFKPYSCARPIHNAIDCALQIRSRDRPSLDRVTGIRMQRHPAWARYHQNANPGTYHEAQVSLPYSVAVALSDGQALFAQYDDERLNDPLLKRLSNLVRFEADDSLPRGVSCRMTLELEGGASHVAQVDHPKGSIRNPMNDDELRAKFDSLAVPVLGAERAGRLADRIREIEACASVGDMMQLAVPAGGRD